jgi:hypothetical protein
MSKLIDGGAGLAVHGALYLVLALLTGQGVVAEHPNPVLLCLIGLAVIMLGLALARNQEGTRYLRGELEALSDLRKDLNSLHINDEVTICGTGVTGAVYLVDEIFGCVCRGVRFKVFVLNPRNSTVTMLASMEPDLHKVVIEPMARRLRTSEKARKILEYGWCDEKADALEAATSADAHRVLIEISAALWQRIGQQAERIAPQAVHGTISVFAYDLVPFLKAWRFKTVKNGAKEKWFYVADQFVHPGVGVDNPMLRFRWSARRAADVSRCKRVDSLIEQFEVSSVKL